MLEHDVEKLRSAGLIDTGVVGDVFAPNVHNGATSRSSAGENELADKVWTQQGDFLSNKAAKRKAQQVDLREFERVNEDDGVARHLRHGIRCLPVG